MLGIKQNSLKYNKSKGVKNKKKMPERTCIGCNEIKAKNELIRIVRNKEGQITIDRTGRANGRGAYICSKKECLEKAIKTKRLERAFATKIDDTIYDDLRGEINE